MTKSKGHIKFKGDFEYYEYGGNVFRAPLHNAFDLNRNVRFGRWECTYDHWREYNGR